MHFPGVPGDVAKQIAEAMRRPEGTIQFVYTFDGLFDPTLGNGIILEIVTGSIIFRLVRDSQLTLHFWHATPSLGTRVASVDIKPLDGSTKVMIFLVWSPTETRLCVGDLRKGKNLLLSGDGKISSKQLRVGSKGEIYEIGDQGVQVMGIEVFENGKPVLEPTAIEAWNNTIEAIKILLKGVSPQGYIFEVITANMVIVMLVTGFETYCKRRFLELETEGILPNFENLAQKVFSNAERERGVIEVVKSEAKLNGIPVTKYIVQQGRIDFQNYERCKVAFNRAFGISFGNDLSVSNLVLEEVQRVINFRHRIVHISPMLGMLNQEKVPPEEPIFANKILVEKEMGFMDDFIKGLHNATQRLRPSSQDSNGPDTRQGASL